MQVNTFIFKKKHELEIVRSNFISHSEASRVLAKHSIQTLFKLVVRYLTAILVMHQTICVFNVLNPGDIKKMF